MTPTPPFTKAEIDEINRYLMAATTPNDPNRTLDGWSMSVPGSVWLLYPVDADAPVQELYPQEILAYVDMLDAAGIKPKPRTKKQPPPSNIHWPESSD